MSEAPLGRTRLGDDTRGVYVISTTPFGDDGSIDFASLDRLLDFFIASGADGVTLLGVLGEAAKLSDAESRSIVEHACRRLRGRLPVVVGASSPGIANLQAFSQEMMDLGAAEIMVSPLTGLKTEDQILAYFDALLGGLGDIPVVLQDYPQHSGVHLSARLIRRLFEQWPCLKVLKHEDVPGLRKISALRADERDGAARRISIMVGNSAMHLPQELRRGVDGANTGVAFPEMLVETVRRSAGGDGEGAENLYDLFLPLIRHEQQPGIGLAIRKEILRRRGLITSARVRAPGPSLDADDHRELGSLMSRLDRKLREAGEANVVIQPSRAAA